MVPELAAGMRSGNACASARSSVSTMRCEVSTLPPATAAGGAAFTMVRSGRNHRTGRINPAVATVCGKKAAENIKHRRPGNGKNRI